jgi:dihydrofolate reductase
MNVALIVAAAKNDVIGCDNKLPWHLPADLKYFKTNTLGKPIIMGRKTFESIGRPLPGRANIVVTRSHNIDFGESVLIAHSLEQALQLAEKVILSLVNPPEEAMVIGGAEIYRAALPLAQRVYLTRVDVEVSGDAYFPVLPESEWRLCSELPGRQDDSLSHQFLIYERTDCFLSANS